MATTEPTKSVPVVATRPHDLFAAVRTEMDRIENAAWAAPGVTRVIDNLRVG